MSISPMAALKPIPPTVYVVTRDDERSDIPRSDRVPMILLVTFDRERALAAFDRAITTRRDDSIGVDLTAAEFDLDRTETRE